MAVSLLGLLSLELREFGLVLLPTFLLTNAFVGGELSFIFINVIYMNEIMR